MTELLNCPKCVGKLEPKKMGSVEVDVCFVCGGIWFDEGELNKAIDARGKMFSLLHDSAEVASFREHKQSFFDNKQDCACPRCIDGSKLLQRRQGGMNVDYCPKGHGVWLDTGEFENMLMSSLKTKYGIFWGFAFFFMLFFSGFIMMFFLGRRSRRYAGSGGQSGGAGASGSW